MSLTSTLPSETNFYKARLLFIEEEDEQWTLIQQALQQCLPEVVSIRVTSPAQALNLLAEYRNPHWEIPRLISLDLNLPTNEDGFRLLA